MELQTAREIVATLAAGLHPDTGEPMPADSPYNAPSVIRALYTAAQALQGSDGAAHAVPARAARPPRVPGEPREGPANRGKPWSGDDDEQLRLGFAAGTPVKDLAAALGRTRWAVESRLVRLGMAPLQATA